jgi:hypothetical protein
LRRVFALHGSSLSLMCMRKLLYKVQQLNEYTYRVRGDIVYITNYLK